MGSKSTRFPKVRLLAAILARHRRVTYTLSLLFLSLVYYYFSSYQQSPYGDYDSTRFGLGGKDAHGELAPILKRKDNGRAAVVILRVVGATGQNEDENEIASGIRGHNYTKDFHPHADVKYLVQLKSHDYPIKAFRGTVCLLGGNANKDDVTPLDTLIRELREELHSPEWIDEIDRLKVIDDSHLQMPPPSSDNDDNNNSTDSTKNTNTQQKNIKIPPIYNATIVPLIPNTIRYLGTTLHTQSSQILQKPNPYSFFCALYEITLRMDQLPPSVLYPRGANVQEGRLTLLTREQLMKHAKYAWGYEYTMMTYFGGRVPAGNMQKGVSVEVVEEDFWMDGTNFWTPEN